MTDFLPALFVILTVLLAYSQIQKTQAANIRAKQAHLRDELRVRIYEGASATFEKANRLVGRSKIDTLWVVSTLKMELDGSPTSLRKTSTDLDDLHLDAAHALSDVFLKLEQYEIAFSRFRTIRRELSEEQRRFLEAYHKLSGKLSLYLPNTDPAAGKPLPRLANPTTENITELDGLQHAYGDVCSNVESFVMDLQIESQNEMLGHLFERQLPPRHPLDPKLKVLKRDPDDAAERPPGRFV